MATKPKSTSALDELTQEVSRLTSALLRGLEEGFERAGVKPEDLEALAARLEREQQDRRARMEAEHEQRVRSFRERFRRP